MRPPTTLHLARRQFLLPCCEVVPLLALVLEPTRYCGNDLQKNGDIFNILMESLGDKAADHVGTVLQKAATLPSSSVAAAQKSV